MGGSTSGEVVGQLPQLFLRLGLGLVFAIFGVWKTLNPVDWIIFTPGWVSNLEGLAGLDTFGFLKLMGFGELVLGIQLLLGLFTRWTAVVCAVGLVGILLHIGFDQVGIRDLGLLFAALSLGFTGGGAWSLDSWLSRSESGSSMATGRVEV